MKEIIVSEMVSNPEKHAYRLTDGTIIKLSWNNPARAQSEILSVGQVINFLPEDILDRSATFDGAYKNIGEKASNPYKVQSEGGEDKNAEEGTDLVSKSFVVYQGIVAHTLELPDVLNWESSYDKIRWTLANENVHLDKMLPFLVLKCLQV